MNSKANGALLAVCLSAACLLGAPGASAEMRGFDIATPRMDNAGVVSGAVCRRERVALRPSRVVLERVGLDGAVVDQRTVVLHGALGRSMGCAFYSVRTDWTVGSGESLRALALR